MIRYISILIVLFALTVQAQNNTLPKVKGFAGRKNYLSTDLLGHLLGRHNVAFSRSLGKHTAFHFGVELDKIKASDKFEQHFRQEGIKYSGTGFIIGFEVNSPTAGIPMPLGYYYGIRFAQSWGELSTGALQDDPFQTDDSYYTIKSSIRKFTLFYGKNTYLGKYMVLGLGLDMGVKWGGYQYLEDVQLYYVSMPYYSYIPIFSEEIDVKPSSEAFSLTGNTIKKIRFANFSILPEVRLGYMF